MTPQEEMRHQANKLNHLSMLYVGSIMELATGKPQGLIPNSTPGLKTTRDVLNLMLFIRAEMNGITRVLIEKKIVTDTELVKIFAEEYGALARVKASQFGCEVTDYGLVFKNDGK